MPFICNFVDSLYNLIINPPCLSLILYLTSSGRMKHTLGGFYKISRSRTFSYICTLFNQNCPIRKLFYFVIGFKFTLLLSS